MVSFDRFTQTDGIPIYQQIILYIRRGLAGGWIVPGDEMPSRRVLSALLGVNPNTVQKAYHLLEQEGVITSTPGAKSLISASPEKIREIRVRLTEHQALDAIGAMKQMGMTLEEALAAITRLWDQAERTEEQVL